MGKTAVFVLATLHQIDPVPGEVQALVLCHTRELAYQICKEFDRFKKYMRNVKTLVIYGGVPVATHKEELKTNTPNIVIGTPGRVLQLVEAGDLKLDNLKFFILDECDQLLEQLGMFCFVVHLSLSLSLSLSRMRFFICSNLCVVNVVVILDMRRDVQKIFRATPHNKQVMMFSATLSKEIRPVCRKFMHNVRVLSWLYHLQVL